MHAWAKRLTVSDEKEKTDLSSILPTVIWIPPQSQEDEQARQRAVCPSPAALGEYLVPF